VFKNTDTTHVHPTSGNSAAREINEMRKLDRAT